MAPRDRAGSGASPPSTRGLRAATILAALLVVAAYSNSFRNAFHFDDQHVVVGNLFIRDLRNVPRFFTDATTFSALPANQTYRPLVSLSLAVDHWIAGGLDPVPFHVTQVALLLATGWLLLRLYRSVYASAGAESWHGWAALFAAALFCVHAGNTQTVNYVSARSELLAGLGVLGSFALHARPGWRRLQLHLVPMMLGALAKTPAVMFAPLLLAYVLLIEQQLSARDVLAGRAWPRVRTAVLGCLPAFAAAALMYLFVEGMNPEGQTYGGAGRWQYLVTQAWVWVRYVRLFFLPTGLSADTDLAPFETAADPRVAAGAALLAASLALAWRWSRSRETRPAAFGLLWFWIALVPSSSVVPLAEVTNDHRVFFPFMGLTAAAVWWSCLRVRAWLGRRTAAASWRPLVAGAAVLVLVAHAAATHARNRVWRDDESLWADVVRKSPLNGRGLMNYGLTKMRTGRYEEARALFLRALARTPSYPVLHVNLAIVTDAMGRSEEAEASYLRALELAPGEVAAHRYYAAWLVRQARSAEALPHLERALELSPGDVAVRHALLDLLAALGDAPRRDALVRQTLELAPADPVAEALSRGRAFGGPEGGSAKDWFAHGLARAGAGDDAQAAQAYRVATVIDPSDPDPWNNLGWSLARLGFYDEAIPAFERAVELRPDFTLARSNLAWARDAPARRFKRAFELQQSGRAAEAIPIYRELILQSPQWVNARYNLGHALMSTGRCAEAVPELERVVAQQPDHPAAHLHLATCLEALGRLEESARHRAIHEGS
jgi:tetratricopeptide (TPR) repeat protein